MRMVGTLSTSLITLVNMASNSWGSRSTTPKRNKVFQYATVQPMKLLQACCIILPHLGNTDFEKISKLASILIDSPAGRARLATVANFKQHVAERKKRKVKSIFSKIWSREQSNFCRIQRRKLT